MYAAPALDIPPGSATLAPTTTVLPDISIEPPYDSSSPPVPSLGKSLASWVHVVPSLLNMYTAPALVPFSSS